MSSEYKVCRSSVYFQNISHFYKIKWRTLDDYSFYVHTGKENEAKIYLYEIKDN